MNFLLYAGLLSIFASTIKSTQNFNQTKPTWIKVAFFFSSLEHSRSYAMRMYANSVLFKRRIGYNCFGLTIVQLKCSERQLTAIRWLLLIVAGDIELNPGPDHETTSELSRIELLNDRNWIPWRDRMERALRAKDLWKVVNGEEAPSDTQRFLQRENRAYDRLSQGLPDTFLYLIRGFDHVKDAWTNLEDYFAEHINAQARTIRSELNSVRLSENGDINRHLDYMRSLSSDLNMMGCPVEEHVFIDLVLASLPRSYEMLVTALEVQEDLTWHKVVNRIKAEASKRKNRSKIDPGFSQPGNQIALAAQVFRGSCYACNRRGHRQRDCPTRGQYANRATRNFGRPPYRGTNFQSRGYFQNNGPTSSNFGSSGNYQYAGRSGHSRGFRGRFRRQRGFGGTFRGGRGFYRESTNAQFAGFDSRNYNGDASLFLANCVPTVEESCMDARVIPSDGIRRDYDKCWYIDSGASRHMTREVSTLENYQRFVEPKGVSLGNGFQVYA